MAEAVCREMRVARRSCSDGSGVRFCRPPVEALEVKEMSGPSAGAVRTRRGGGPEDTIRPARRIESAEGDLGRPGRGRSSRGVLRSAGAAAGKGWDGRGGSRGLGEDGVSGPERRLVSAVKSS